MLTRAGTEQVTVPLRITRPDTSPDAAASTVTLSTSGLPR